MILVVGGAGYIGSHVNKLLNEKGFQTVVYDNLVYGHREFLNWGNFVLGDLDDISQLRLLFKKYPIKAVMHFSSYIFVGESVSDPQKYYINNISNSINLLKVMLENNVKNFIFSSTAAVYGNPENNPISESQTVMPINPYGQTKLLLEYALADYHKAYGLNYIALRYFNASGADSSGLIGEWHEPETHLIPLILDAALGKKDSVKVFGTDYSTPDGTCIRDYIHVTDLATAHVLALESLLHGGNSDVFNLGYGHGYSVKEVIEAVKKVTGKKLNVIEENRRPGDPPILVANSDKLKQQLGWKPAMDDLEKIISTAWNWHQILYSKFKK